jgi:hypothetical protein
MVSINVPKYKIRTTRWIGPRRIISGTIIHDNGVKGQIVLLELRWDNKSGQQKWIIKLKKERCHWWHQTYFAWVGRRGGGDQRKMGADMLWADGSWRELDVGRGGGRGGCKWMGKWVETKHRDGLWFHRGPKYQNMVHPP